MKLLDLFEREQSKWGTIFNAALKAKASLSPAATSAMEHWLTINWTRSQIATDYKAGKTGVFAEVYDKFEPVRQELRRVYGDTVPLFRGIRNAHDGGANYDTSDNRLYSWSFDRGVAAEYANNYQKVVNYKPLTPQEINQLVAQFNRTGYLAYNGKKYKRNASDPEMYDIYDNSRGHITSNDDIRQDIEDDEEHRRETMERQQNMGRVSAKQIPVNDIVYVSVDSAKEVVVAGHPQ